MSFQYTKRFIDDEIRRLNEPLTLDLEKFSGDGLSSKKLQQVLNRVNVNLRKHNRQLFNSQVVEQVTQQIIKNEHRRLVVINETLMKLNSINIPIVIPNFNRSRVSLDEFSRLVRNLPDSSDLFLGLTDGNSPHADEAVHYPSLGRDDDVSDNSDGDDVLVQDSFMNTIESELEDTSLKYDHKNQRKAERSLKKRIIDTVKNKNLDRSLADYNELRGELIKLDTKLRYNNDKLDYLKDLKNTIRSSLLDSAGFGNTSRISAEIKDSDEEDEGTNDNEDGTSKDPEVDRYRGIQKNLIYAAGSNIADESSLYTELAKFRVLVEKLNYKLAQFEESSR